jgi:hypothetical protein
MSRPEFQFWSSPCWIKKIDFHAHLYHLFWGKIQNSAGDTPGSCISRRCCILFQGKSFNIDSAMRAQRIARQASRSQMYVNRSNTSPASSSPSFLYACCAYREGGKTMEEEQSQVLCSNSKPIWIDNMCFWCRVTYPISHLTTRRTSPCPQCQLASQIAHIQRHLWCRSPSCRYQKLVAKSVWENFWP